MKKFAILVSLIVIIFFAYRYSSRTSEIEFSKKGTSALELSTPQPTAIPVPVPVPLPSTSPVPDSPKPEKETENPYAVDRFTLRKLDFPMPKSIFELFSKVTDYKEPILPDPRPGAHEVEYDGDILSGPLWGDFKDQNGNLKPIKLVRSTGGISLSLENGPVWRLAKNELVIKNFNDDPYSLVIFTPDKRILYLKFFSKMEIPDGKPPRRAMKGWLFPTDNLSTKAFPAIIISLDFANLSPEDLQQGTWPPQEIVEKLLPRDLPAK